MSYHVHPVVDFASVVDSDTQFVDVRTVEEVADGTLPGAVNVPLDELSARVGDLDPQRRVVLLCRSGNRSGQAAEFLDAAGFVDVYNLEGGMLAYATANTGDTTS